MRRVPRSKTSIGSGLMSKMARKEASSGIRHTHAITLELGRIPSVGASGHAQAAVDHEERRLRRRTVIASNSTHGGGAPLGNVRSAMASIAAVTPIGTTHATVWTGRGGHG